MRSMSSPGLLPVMSQMKLAASSRLLSDSKISLPWRRLAEGGNDHRYLSDDLNGFFRTDSRSSCVSASESKPRAPTPVRRACIGEVSFGRALSTSITPPAGCGWRRIRLERGVRRRRANGHDVAGAPLPRGSLLGEVVDVVAAIDQFTDLTTDIAQVGSAATLPCPCRWNLQIRS